MSSKKIRVMISSRCNDPFPAGGDALSVLRRALKAELEAVTLLGQQLFEVWINEDAPPADAVADSTGVCLQAVDESDVLIVLSNGNAGWATSSADIGICHAELMRGVTTAAGKVRLVSLGEVPLDSSEQGLRNGRFQDYLRTQNLFRGGTVKSVEEAKQRVSEAVFDAVTSLARLGVREARKGKFHTGEALAWSSLSFSDRQRRIVDSLTDAFAERPSANRIEDAVTLPVGGARVLFAIHAVPAALTVAAAREMVGRPFLQDYRLAGKLADAHGPVHVIGCQKSATETQASSLLGFPDATFVATPFGVYVADNIQKVQFVFLQNCRDRTTTRYNVQRFFEWLSQSGEDHWLVARAKSRTKIVKAIQAEL